eukprot:CAMPEP_0119122596 /NCGR_PEP_ID=MMETSP1310-20130426/2797_1 /TAXON_ID=464262 /ORGANISM="Genus nov. species nov., Strain RCC2339" /LENGTH=648 /DNA_ID=CAMNT_0007112277 /DNA_START=138 /DNA_END=2084 /DNA_ORIENTATION=-
MCTSFQYGHVHAYVHNIQSFEHYFHLEKISQFVETQEAEPISEVQEKCNVHFSYVSDSYQPEGQDLVEQFILGLGWRIIGTWEGNGVRTVVLSSNDKNGAKFIITGKTNSNVLSHRELSPIFHENLLQSFFDEHNGREGFAVLSLQVPTGYCDVLFERYNAHHKLLLQHDKVQEFSNGMKVLQVYGFYKDDRNTIPDRGTSYRFIESDDHCKPLPGIVLREPIAGFPGKGAPVYSDHWASNVFFRDAFLNVLQETLDFIPKINFNAGIVSAGEATIESVVIGNTIEKHISPFEALEDQSQIYFPTTTALSEAGHVYDFLKQYGQGVQHLANRVPDIVKFVTKANRLRTITNKGFRFVSIPRSYYGTLATVPKDTCISTSAFSVIQDVLQNTGCLLTPHDLLLDVSEVQIRNAIKISMQKLPRDEYFDISSKFETLVQHILRSPYSNLFGVLGDRISRKKYLEIVRCNILVDIQGEDILYQIFTVPVLLPVEPGSEAPFLEFIERVCYVEKTSEGDCLPVRPGCGGFGIRNFLTLFLSVELNNALSLKRLAEQERNVVLERNANLRIRSLCDQLNEANPVMSSLGDALRDIAKLTKQIEELNDSGFEENYKHEKLQKELDNAIVMKGNYQRILKDIADRYKQIVERTSV